MNTYHNMNEMIEYIEKHLNENIEYKDLAKILGVNEYTMKVLFSFICNISLAEYIRKRRLSSAGLDLCTTDEKIIDLAVKYQYDNATSFSRAFEKFHGIKPSMAKENPNGLKVYPKIVLNESEEEMLNMEYSIIERQPVTLYGKGIKTTHDKISKDAPKLYKEIYEKYSRKYGEINYGMTVYEDRFESDNYEYWVLYNKEIPSFTKCEIAGGRYLRFTINSQIAEEIQKVTNEFYKNFLPSCKFNLRELPELEYYHDEITDFLVPIEN